MNKISFYGNTGYDAVSKERENLAGFPHSAQTQPVETVYYFVKEGSLNEKQKQYIKENFFDTELHFEKEFSKIPNDKSEENFLQYMNKLNIDVDIHICRGRNAKKGDIINETPEERNIAINNTASRIKNSLQNDSIIDKMKDKFDTLMGKEIHFAYSDYNDVRSVNSNKVESHQQSVIKVHSIRPVNTKNTENTPKEDNSQLINR